MKNPFAPRRVAALLAVLLLAPGFSPAQNVGKVSGVVRDAETREPIVGCNVIVVGTQLGASTDVEGAFFILNVPPGKYDLQASMIGYHKTTQTGAVVNAGRTTTANFMLEPEAVAQPVVVIEAVRPDVELEKTSTSAIVRSEDVQQIAGIRDVGDILALAADVTDGHFRGGREGEEYYTLQGMGIINPLNNATAFLPIMSAVEEVEVITSGFGAQYGNAQSGVVNISMKEGKSDKWRTRIESRMRAPGRKHFGPSAFDPASNPYLAALLDPAVWQLGDPGSGNTPYFQSMGSGLINMYGGDPEVQLMVARTLWQMQARRDLYLNYGRDVDYSTEVATGGPVDEGVRMFAALRANTEWPTFPTEEANVQRQVMGNIAADIGTSSTLRISGGFEEQRSNVFPGSNGTGYLNWLWDRILSINYQRRSNLQLGVRFSHAMSASTFYEIKLNSLWTKRKVGSTPSPSAVADSLIVNPLNQQIDWDKIIPQVITAPDGFAYLRGDDEFRDELTRTVSFDASMSSQVTKSHLLNGGVQLNSYLIDVANALNTRRGAGGPVETYRVTPLEAALYLQDKMEFEGLIANVGLRFDLWDANAPSYATYLRGIPVVDDSEKISTPILGRLQPRAGVSFPVSVNTVFHLNYGSFMQRPSFQYIVSSRYRQGQTSPLQVGNPRLQPETTNSYDIGVTQGLGEGFTLDVSGYYKDVKNLVETATFEGYSTWFNRDYADIRGFRVALTKRKGDFTGSVNYQFGVATGKSSTTSNAPVAFRIDPATGAIIEDLEKVPVRDIPLNFDRTHNVILNLGCTSGPAWGPEFLGTHPLADLTFSSHSFFKSGRPYTSPSDAKVINGARTPWEYNTNVRLTKRIPSFFGTAASLYVEVFNLFDDKILNYDYIFATPDANTTTNILRAYENFPIDDPQRGILYWPDTNPPLDWAVDQSFLVYDNAPRSFTFGLAIEF